MSGTASDPAIGYEALRTTVATQPLGRDVVRLAGPDALSYLQGQCSQDVADLAVGATTEALLLSPQGKVDAFVRITRTGEDELVLDVDGGAGDAVQARLERFRLRVKATVERVDGWACVAVRGPGAEGATTTPGSGVLRLPVAWPGLDGFDLLGPAPDGGGGAVDAWVGGDVVRCGDDAWEAVRIEAGIPAQGREVTESTIPAEVGLVERSVSFTKGCFTGQELVARLDARGSNVARRLRGLVVTGAGGAGAATGGSAGGGAGLPPVGATVTTADGAHEVGTVSSVAWSPRLGLPVALAVLHRRVVPPEGVVLRWTAGGSDRQVGAEARELPLAGPPEAPAG